jgi:diaminopimelate epimerase
MPGGRIDIEISPDFAISMTGSVTKIATGTIDPEMLTWEPVSR